MRTAYVKLFEEFIKEDILSDLGLDSDKESKDKESKDKESKDSASPDDVLAGLGIGDGDKEEKKDSEDFFRKEKEKIQKKKEKEEERHENFVETKKSKIEKILKEYPEIEKGLGDRIIKAIDTQDRVKIHNMFNDLMALQIDYQERGDLQTVDHIAKLKDQLEDLDKSYTSDKMM